jgi:hypothetical protein
MEITPEMSFDPLQLAISLARTEEDQFEQTFRLGKVAFVMAEEGNTDSALGLCNEIPVQELGLPALFELSLIMLKAGHTDSAWNTLDSIIEACRSEACCFFYDELLPQLDYLHAAGWKVEIMELLHMALTLVSPENNDLLSGYRLKYLIETLRQLASHWKEKAEEIVEQILELPLDRLDSGHHDGRWALFEMALIIRKHNLAWDKGRSYRFLKHYAEPAGINLELPA